MIYLAKKELDAANAAYQLGNYSDALANYENAITKLRELGAQKGFFPTKFYYDELAYTHSQIIKCISQIVQALIAESPNTLQNYDLIQFNMRKARSNRKDFLVLHNTLAQYFGGISRNSTERLTEVFGSLAETAEKISDAISDYADSEQYWVRKDKAYMKAVMWLQRAQKYQLKANSSLDTGKNNKKTSNIIRTELHLGCLNLMERAYYCNHDETYLLEITKYISDNRLHGLNLTSEEQLELLSYELLVAVEESDEEAIHILSQYYEAILINNPDFDENCSLIQDIKKLLAKVNVTEEAIEPEPTSEPNPKKRDREEAEVLSLTKKAKLTENVMGADVPHLLEEAPYLESNVPSEEQAPMPPLLQVEMVTRPLPQVVLNLTRVAPSLPFFAPVPMQKPSQITFSETMKELAGSYNNSETLANLLIVVADFYSQGKHSQSPKAMFIACSLYEDVLRLNPKHNVARSKKDELKSTPLGAQVFKLVVSDKKHTAVQYKTASDLFNHSIAESIKNVQTYLVENNQKQLDELFTKLLQFIGATLKKEHSVGNQSEEIADLILSKCLNDMLVEQSFATPSFI
ncbi:hypothetical protein [Legionella rowbothamii]|uniref:hypothetical protein n=1 Tax=Legionella rowbothamii TaxID=96229 RepID=UPI001055E0F3|nr:hypothetical protein [Legionella rowbothamii]